MSKKTTKQRNKAILKNYEANHPATFYYSEGHWEDSMLENNSYYDIDILAKANAPVYEKINEWTKKYSEASSWLGKWYCQIQIDKWKKKLKHYESKSRTTS